MLNRNVLRGLRCPQCGQNNCFMINVVWSGQAHVYDDGTDEKSGGNTEWFDDSPATCVECDWSGEAGDLLWPTKIPVKLKEILVTLLEYIDHTRETSTVEWALEKLDLNEATFDQLTDLLSAVLEENK